MELGELDGADLTVTTDYETARKVFVDQDQAAGHAGVHVRQDQGAGRHDEDDGDADVDAERRHREDDRQEIKDITE